MNFERWGETILGAIVVVVAVGFFAFASAQGGQSDTRGGYDLKADFQRVDGIAIGSDVRISGVKVGVVKAVTLNPTTYQATLVLSINNGVQVLDDSVARVTSDGLLGGAHISIEPAGMEPLAAGGTIPNTQGAVDLLTLFASFAQGQGNNNNSNGASQSQNQDHATP
jgi:phospholipid/cholesterol/gamma-HCH transport system substrate-binding protein